MLKNAHERLFSGAMNSDIDVRVPGEELLDLPRSIVARNLRPSEHSENLGLPAFYLLRDRKREADIPNVHTECDHTRALKPFYGLGNANTAMDRKKELDVTDAWKMPFGVSLENTDRIRKVVLPRKTAVHLD
jgi:hypothetical protein